MLANDLSRWTREGRRRRGCILVILCIVEMEVPCIIYVDDMQSKGISNSPDKADGDAAYVDEEGNALLGKNTDVLGAAVRYAHRRALGFGQPVWSKEVLEYTTDDVVAEFYFGLGDSEFIRKGNII